MYTCVRQWHVKVRRKPSITVGNVKFQNFTEYDYEKRNKYQRNFAERFASKHLGTACHCTPVGKVTDYRIDHCLSDDKTVRERGLLTRKTPHGE